MTRKLFDKNLELAALATTTLTVTVGSAVSLQMSPSYYANMYQSHWEAKLVIYGLAIATGTPASVIFTVTVGDDSSFTHNKVVLTQDVGSAPTGKYEFTLDFAGIQEIFGTSNLPILYIKLTCTLPNGGGTTTGTVTYGAFLSNC